jgi:uncharacterized membrane protein
MKETARIEAFSDGVLAIIITLLAFELRIPQPPNPDNPDFSLLAALLERWPVYLAFVLGFVFVLITWINHHRLFIVIRRTDNNLLLLNGLLLFGLSLIPFATNLISGYLQHHQQNIAFTVMSLIFLLNSLFFNFLWRYASHNNRLFSHETDLTLVAFISRQYAMGPFLYLITTVIAYFVPILALAIHIGLATFFALPNKAVQQMVQAAEAEQ